MIPLQNDQGRFQLIHRSGWAARAPKGEYGKLGQVQRIVIHHSLTLASGYSDRTIHGIQDYHMDKNGWADIGYHFVMTPDGAIVYEGRPLWALGAHCGGSKSKTFGNKGSIGICVLGNYDQEHPNAFMLVQLKKLIDLLLVGNSLDKSAVVGHVESWKPGKQEKTCPGKHLFLILFGAKRWIDQTGDKDCLPGFAGIYG